MKKGVRGSGKPRRARWEGRVKSAPRDGPDRHRRAGALPGHGSASRAAAPIGDAPDVPSHICDAQIAAIARFMGTSIATRNTAEFDGCGVIVVDPRFDPRKGVSPTPALSRFKGLFAE